MYISDKPAKASKKSKKGSNTNSLIRASFVTKDIPESQKSKRVKDLSENPKRDLSKSKQKPLKKKPKKPKIRESLDPSDPLEIAQKSSLIQTSKFSTFEKP